MFICVFIYFLINTYKSMHCWLHSVQLHLMWEVLNSVNSGTQNLSPLTSINQMEMTGRYYKNQEVFNINPGLLDVFTNVMYVSVHKLSIFTNLWAQIPFLTFTGKSISICDFKQLKHQLLKTTRNAVGQFHWVANKGTAPNNPGTSPWGIWSMRIRSSLWFLRCPRVGTPDSPSLWRPQW